jgi:polar amino acid transport system permease protein
VGDAFDPRGLLAYTYDWDIFFRSVFQPDGLIIRGVLTTVYMAVIAQVFGVVLGTLAALGRMARLAPVRLLSSFYVWFFRGTPLLVQLSFIYFGLSVTGIYRWPDIELGAFTIPGNIQAGIFALGLNEGAYMSGARHPGAQGYSRGHDRSGAGAAGISSADAAD